MDFSNLISVFNRHGFIASAHRTKEEACSAALKIIGASSVGSGGSRTIGETGILDRLVENGNTVFCHSLTPDAGEKAMMRKNAMGADVYLTSVNAVVADGSLFNIDGTGNRVAATLFGPKTVVVIAGRNKVVADAAEALERTRRDCCPPNARRLKNDTPCAKTGVCADCNCEGRMCRAFVTIARPTRNVDKFYVLLVDEELGW